MRRGKPPKGGEKYPEHVRAFSLKLHFLSPASYEFVRTEFEKVFPHISTIKAWYRNSNLDAKSGIGEASMNILQEKVIEMEKKGQRLICSLVFDEMAIRKHQQWSSSENRVIGTVSYGIDEKEIANNALVFLVHGLNIRIQMPVAYYFITTLNSEQRESLILEILAEFSRRRIIISNITFDGLPANASMCISLGASFDADNMQSFFIDPESQRKIYIIFDPSHCIKLVRNNLFNRAIIWDRDNREIRWEYFEKLVKFGENGYFNLTHKMTKRHIEFENQKMRVQLAVQTLSNSSADSLQFLMEANANGFANATAPIKFIRIFNNLFDIMNSQRIMNDHPNPFKSALNEKNKSAVFTFLIEAKEYITGLKVKSSEFGKKVAIIESKIKTGFRGFLITIDSVVKIYQEYVEEHHFMLMIATYRLSQDHLEMFFGKIRTMHGCNDNPTIIQFMSSYKKLQLIGDIGVQREGGNVSQICSSNVLTVSSIFPKNKSNVQIEADFEQLAIERVVNCNFLLDKCKDSSIAFVAHTIENRLLKYGQIYCQLCQRVLLENEKFDRQNCIGSKIPSKSTFLICKATDRAVRQLFDKKDPNFKVKITNSVLSSIEVDNIFPRYFEPEHDCDHKYFLIRYIIHEYMHIICTHISKKMTIDMHKTYFRNAHRKDIHFAGQ